ncbi:hypothetical protein B6N60_03304 [Richelia sinica FACHB-800]|uniref:Uncharacterized protein n=1 Tax=Richelia sinica FACHB-800 TaxID=1357546 RepID=A0A975Y5V1_9NOST|nr:hypothetical protein B6N60_03304 [Richelia sinica FACHB-800]
MKIIVDGKVRFFGTFYGEPSSKALPCKGLVVIKPQLP